MITNNNRVEEFAPPEAADEPVAGDLPATEDFAEYVALAKEWARNNPIPCLAGAFIAGAVIAWMIKRK